MKNYCLCFSLFLLISLTAYASDPAYKKAMRKEILQMKAAATPTDFQKSANSFARIAEMNQSEWLPQYYAGLVYANMGFRSDGTVEEKDGLFAQAKKHVEKALSIAPSNSEIVALQGYILMGELSADPESRGQHMSPLVMQTFGKAIDLNRQNPRAILMMAQMEYGMAQFFGQGPEKACGLVKASLDLFDKEAAEANEESIQPTWGREMAEQLVGVCP